jgi:hypothetical protein
MLMMMIKMTKPMMMPLGMTVLPFVLGDKPFPCP